MRPFGQLRCTLSGRCYVVMSLKWLSAGSWQDNNTVASGIDQENSILAAMLM